MHNGPLTSDGAISSLRPSQCDALTTFGHQKMYLVYGCTALAGWLAGGISAFVWSAEKLARRTTFTERKGDS